MSLITRVTDPTIQEFAEVILKNVCETYGHRTINELFSWLRSATQSADYYFVHTKNAIGLARRFRTLMHMRDDVEEVFLLAKSEEHLPECEEIAKDIMRWATMINGKDLLLGNCTMLPKEKYKETFGRVLDIKTAYVKIPVQK